MSDQFYAYPPEVIADILVEDQIAYTLAAEFINRQGYDVLSVQHEYGIFGGIAGRYLLQLVRSVTMPVVTTLHTVLRNPSPEQREVMEELLQLSTRVVVMSRTATELLVEVHGIDRSKIDFIPHGIPTIPVDAGAKLREQIGGQGPILLTFGLLSPDKGIENVIRALPKIVKQSPDAKYLLVGATHPHVKATTGERYRNSLISLVHELGLESSVEFIGEFVAIEKLIEYLSACHFYVTPYLNPMQITSGTLAYSLGAGKVVISSPYEYAQEVLADGRGMIVPFRDHEAIADAVLTSWESQPAYEAMARKAASYGSQMYWDRVGKLYHDTFKRARDEAKSLLQTSLVSKRVLPDLNVSHLEVLSDDTGIFQHAIFGVPNRDEGYCVDDNARALLLTVMLESNAPLTDKLQRLQARYLSFVVHAYDPSSGKFRNFMSFQRNWLESTGSEDSQGRSLWALGMTAARSRSLSNSNLASKIFLLSAASLHQTKSPRTWAYAILGSIAFLEHSPDSSVASELLLTLSKKLDDRFRLEASPPWPWPEARLSYANARIPQALMLAGARLQDSAMQLRGIESLRWLMEKQITHWGCFSPVGTLGADVDELGSIQFDQQPIEAWSSVSACITAYDITGESRFLELANLSFEWFLGRNVNSMPVANSAEGSCFDGLLHQGLNQNQGAESTLSYLCALTELRRTRELNESIVKLQRVR